MNVSKCQYSVAGKVNHRFDVALAMCHRLWFIHLQAQWSIRNGRWAPRLHSYNECGTVYRFCLFAAYHSWLDLCLRPSLRREWVAAYLPALMAVFQVSLD